MTGRVARVLLVLFAVTAATGAPSLARAAVRCEVQVIHATAGADPTPYVDPALKSIATYLQKSFGARYSSFRQLDHASLSLELTQRATLMLPDERELALTFKGVSDGFIRLFMELPHLRTTVKVRDAGLFFQAGQSYQGGMLVLAVRAHLAD